MSDRSDFHRSDLFPEPMSLEAIIRSAGNYVVASDDLRPQVIEAALERQALTSTRRRIGGIALAACLFFMLFVPLIRSSNIGPSNSIFPTSADIHQAALRYAADANISSDWALQEVIGDLRRTQGQRIRQATR